MSFQARVGVDVVFHESNDSQFSVGSVSDHRASSSPCTLIVSVAGAEPHTITAGGITSLSTLAVKNTGSQTIRLAGAIDVQPGRVAVLPVTTSVSVEAPGGGGQYSAVWVG